VSEGSVTQNEAKLASTLFYGLMGGFAGAGSCCCWPVSIAIAWLATRRAVDRGTIEAGDGLGYGFGLGLVMAAVMSTLGTALGLSNLKEPQGEMVATMLADTPTWLLAMAVMAMLGVVGLVSGLVGGILGAGQRKVEQTGSAAVLAERVSVPIPGSMSQQGWARWGYRSTEGQEHQDAPESAEGSETPVVINPEDFLTADSEPQPHDLEISSSLGSESKPDDHAPFDPEHTVTIDQDPSDED